MVYVMKKKSKKKLRINKRNPVAKALRTPRFRSRVELDRKREMKKTGKHTDEE
jgi:hypothetical protein